MSKFVTLPNNGDPIPSESLLLEGDEGGVEVPNIFPNRSVFARHVFLREPEQSQVDDDGLVWVPNTGDGLWYSIAGNYSRYSPAQKRQIKAEREMDYEKRLETAEQLCRRIFYESEIRQAVLDRDDYTCQVCGHYAQSSLHVHHILKRKEGGTDHLDNLITVCPSCHKRADTALYNPDWVVLP